MSRLPLRQSLLWAIIGLTAVALAVAGAASLVALRAYLIERTDEQLDAAASLAAQRWRMLENDDGRGVTTLRTVIIPSDYVVEFRPGDGQVTRLAGPADLAVGTLANEAPPAPVDGQVSAPVSVAGGYRVVTARADDATVVVGLSLAPVQQTVRRLAMVESVAGLLVLLLLGGLARLLLRRGLRPLDEIAATATAIADGDLDRRLPEPPRHVPAERTEVGRLTAAVNGMLGRIQAALADRTRSEDRLRHFVADASHELRTPLTSIRGYLQLLRQNIITEADRPDALRRADEEATRMATIVDDLLYLARLDIEPGLRHEPVDLAAVVRDCAADLLAVQPDRSVRQYIPASCPVTGDSDALCQVMTNLFANVRVHTPVRARVTVTLTATKPPVPGPVSPSAGAMAGHGTVTVTIADEGPGMPADLAGRAFDRFARGDAASQGSGLGLSIVAEIVAAHGGSVRLDSHAGRGTTVAVTLPAACR